MGKIEIMADKPVTQRVPFNHKNKIGKPTRVLKPIKDIRTHKPMKILLTNKTPKSTTKLSNKAQRLNLHGKSNYTGLKEPAKIQFDTTKTKKVDIIQKKKLISSRTESTVPRKTNQMKVNLLEPTKPSLTRRQELELWRAEKGRNKKENCHPLLSRKRALAKVVTSPSFNPVEQKKIPLKNQRRHSIAPVAREFPVKTVGKKCRRKTVSNVCQRQPMSTKCTLLSPVIERTPWKNKTISIRQRLDMWLESKGKTPHATPRPQKTNCKYTKSPHPSHATKIIKEISPKIPEDLNTTFTIEDDSEDCSIPQLLQDKSEITKEKLNKLLEKLAQEINGEEVQSDLDELIHQTPNVVHYADYWICRARLAAQQNDVQRVVCLLEQAYTFDAKPEEKIKEEICSFLENIEAADNNNAEETEKDYFTKYAITPGRRVHFAVNTMSPLQFKSSIIRFCIVESKTFKRRLNAQIKRKIMTPVRRSTRLQRSDLPSFLKSDDRIILSPSEVESEIIDGEISFRPNKTINTPLNNGWLLQDDIRNPEDGDKLELSFM